MLQSTHWLWLKDARWQPIDLGTSDSRTSAGLVRLGGNYGAGLVAQLADGLRLSSLYSG